MSRAMRWAHRDLQITVGAAVVTAILVALLPDGILRALAGVVLALVLPGYALTAALFARHRLEVPVRLLLTLALSVAALAIGSIVGQVTPDGLTSGAWIGRLLAVVLIACLVAAMRRPEPGADSAARLRAGAARLPRPRAVDAVLVSLAVLVAGAGVVLARTPLSNDKVVGYTQLWMVPGGSTLQVGVRSAETTAQAYRLEVRVAGRRRVVRSRLVLQPGTRFDYTVSVPPRRSATRVSARLYRLDRPHVVYRRVTAEVRS